MLISGKKTFLSSSFLASSKCYIHDRKSKSWRLHASMSTVRSSYASATIHGGLWLIGGTDDKWSNLKSTEIVFSNGSVVKGPDLPTPRSGHCAVDLLDGRIMIIGGKPNTKNVIMYNSVDGSFSPAPSLLFEKVDSACTLFHSPMHDHRLVVLVAGSEDHANDVYGASALLDFTDPTAVWKQSEL